MSYARWSYSDWYIYADVGGGLTIHLRRSDATYNFSEEQVSDLLSGRDNIYESIPEAGQVSSVSYDELILCLHQYLKDERGVKRDDFEDYGLSWRQEEKRIDVDVLEKALEKRKKHLKEHGCRNREIELGLLGARK